MDLVLFVASALVYLLTCCRETPLRAFLQASMLSTDTEETDDDSNEVRQDQ